MLSAAAVSAVVLLFVIDWKRTAPPDNFPKKSPNTRGYEVASESAAAIASCNLELVARCMQDGGVRTTVEVSEQLKRCQNVLFERSDQPELQWKDVWTTSTYSYAPGGGGPGGGRDDDVLKVGGWGDLYYSLIRFKLPPLRSTPQFAAIALFSKTLEDARSRSTPVTVDRITQNWSFPDGDRLWWKDRPGVQPFTAETLPVPEGGRWYVIGLTELAQAWFDRKLDNYGIQIRPLANNNDFAIFASSDAPDKSKIPRLLFCL